MPASRCDFAFWTPISLMKGSGQGRAVLDRVRLEGRSSGTSHNGSALRVTARMTPSPKNAARRSRNAASPDQLATIAARLPKNPTRSPSGPHCIRRNARGYPGQRRPVSSKICRLRGFFCAQHKNCQKTPPTDYHRPPFSIVFSST